MKIKKLTKSAKSDKNVFYSIRKNNTKLPWSMSAKLDT